MANNFIKQQILKVLGMNKYNQAFYSFLGGLVTKYDSNNITYIEKGYNINADVYSCVSQMANKTVSVPFCVKKIKDSKSFKALQSKRLATKGDNTILQSFKLKSLETKAFSTEELDFPLERPNVNQTWAELIYLYKVFIKTTGNCYFYIQSPSEGMNKGVPIQVYVLPAHLIQIVLKPNANLLGVENPIDYYMLTEGNQWTRFEATDIIHVKLANPNFDMQGSHLYGMSPLRAALLNIQSQNIALDLNLKTLQNGGAFGFIHGKNEGLTTEQAQSIKDRLIEMDASPDRLSRIAGASGDLAFTRISLTTDELKPFDYLKYDQKQICSVLGWSDRLLNNNEGTGLSKLDLDDVRKSLVIENILPDLKLLEEALNTSFIPRFKGYENAVIEWDVTELPEMQTDMKDLIDVLEKIGTTPNEKREAFNYESLNDDGMDTVWLPNNMKRVDDVSEGVFNESNQ